MLGHEARIDAQELAEARQEQPRADEPDEGERHLWHDEAPAQVPRAPARRPRPRVLAQGPAQGAPSAWRVASSLRRPLALTSERLVRFTAAMTSTNRTPPQSSWRAARTFRTTSASSETTRV